MKQLYTIAFCWINAQLKAYYYAKLLIFTQYTVLHDVLASKHNCDINGQVKTVTIVTELYNT